ncbi:hypothetical protein EXIGLDRAFT_96881 [Exidia glandulosa HHB12029]|uniref:Uncharacterized protein n=1 Tax=Exidia glandulosa HHB12029 TaxID=1314781 RepID=A0A165H3D5_EXIGL|nr:hypothetical protein EXIGLDRAFT_96881 [Exidia glandulosa HHB12029]
MQSSLVPYTVLLTAPSPLFGYFPYRDSDVSVGWNASYTHSTTWPDRAQPTTSVSTLGAPYRRTRLKGASVSLLFEGTGLFICFTSSGASYTITLDSVSEASTSASVDGTPCEQSGAQAIFRADNLSMSSHNATIVVTSTPPDDADFSFFGGGITLGLNTEGYAVDNTSMIDDQDSSWALEPGRNPGSTWDTHFRAWYFNHTVTFNCLYGAQ